ncbi:extracellular solute-binding protein [Arthrobacter sp. NPDC090010]|uniref:sugar ABC transporter substrate-binding protein n=1 Tax=Arthrobacter sp. NPDC090010 TaxID=3363942 RepID=UPI0038015F47
MDITRRSALSGLAMTALFGLAACSGGTDSSASSSPSSGGLGSDNHQDLTVLIGSSGDAETTAVKAAVEAWSKKSGTMAKVVVASDLNQQLAQGFSGGSPADVFYLTNDSVAGYAGNGSLEPYVDSLKSKDAFYPSLISAFTVDGKAYAAPKDFSTLALIINTDLWKAAGLGEADEPKSWDQLEAVAKKLTSGGKVGLSTSSEFQRLGVFMAQAGGWLTDEQGKAAADSDANAAGLDFAKKLLNEGSYKFAAQLGTGWGGEAFGTGKAAMTIEGNWITGAMDKNYPGIKYKVIPLPSGPKSASTIQYDGGWGMAAQSKNKGGALDLIDFLTQPDQQMGFAKAFGVMPSLKDLTDTWKKQFPQDAAFMDAVNDSKSIPSVSGLSDILKDFNSQLESLASGDPKAILSSVQNNLKALPGLS